MNEKCSLFMVTTALHHINVFTHNKVIHNGAIIDASCNIKHNLAWCCILISSQFLPDPVSAAPIMSRRPLIAAGRVCLWIGVGSLNPRSRRASKTGSGTKSSFQAETSSFRFASFVSSGNCSSSSRAKKQNWKIFYIWKTSTWLVWPVSVY